MTATQHHFINAQKECLRGMLHGDLHLRKYFTEWDEDLVSSSFTFGNFLLVKYETDMLAAHHHGFSQGVHAAVKMRQERNQKEQPTNHVIWGVCLALGGAGVSACIYTITRVESPFALVIACIVAGPCTILHLVGAIMLVSDWLKPHMKEADVIPIEYDPDKRAKYIEDEEKRALEDFLKSHRSVGGDGPSADV